MNCALPRPGAIEKVAADLRRMGVGDVAEGVDLRSYSRWRSGGRAAVVVSPDSRQGVSRLLHYFHHHGIGWAVIGGGSNLLFDDRGVHVPLIHIGRRLAGVEIADDILHAEAGAWVPGVALRALHAGLGGIEHIVGIPGTLGGLVIMNGGSLRRGVGECVTDVEIVDADGSSRLLNQEACAFAYRRSVFQKRPWVVVAARLRLVPRAQSAMRSEMLAIMQSRRRRFPRTLPNCGSVFVSDPELYAAFGAPGAVIERCGLKGARIGGALVSPKHANFILNSGDASAVDILTLVAHVRRVVAARTGLWMRCEVRFMDATGEIREAHAWLDDPAWRETRGELMAATEA